MMGFGFGMGMWVFILFFGLLVWGLIAFINGQTRSDGRVDSRSSSAKEIMDKRYARGDISKDQYEDMKQDLLD